MVLKRIFCMVFAWIFLLSLVGCSQEEIGTSEPFSDVSSESSDASDKKTKPEEKKPGPPVDAPSPADPDAVVYDPSLEHKIIGCDLKNASIVVLDLNQCEAWADANNRSCLVWEWKARNESTCRYSRYVGSGIDEAKLRYSSYYKTDVVIATSSGGWAGVIEYPSGKVLWESLVPHGPHSIEMLPDGDIVVASSGGNKWSKNGTLFYFALSSGSTTVTSSINLPSAHGLCWDPSQEILWGLGMDEITGYRVIDGGTTDARLEAIEGKRVTFLRDNGGHDLVPVFGQPGKYWATCAAGLWFFDSHTMTVTGEVDYRSTYTGENIKGLAYFADGTMVQSRAGYGRNTISAHGATTLAVLTLSAKESDPSQIQAVRGGISFQSREFYKVHTFTRDYQ